MVGRLVGLVCATSCLVTEGGPIVAGYPNFVDLISEYDGSTRMLWSENSLSPRESKKVCPRPVEQFFENIMNGKIPLINQKGSVSLYTNPMAFELSKLKFFTSPAGESERTLGRLIQATIEYLDQRPETRDKYMLQDALRGFFGPHPTGSLSATLSESEIDPSDPPLLVACLIAAMKEHSVYSPEKLEIVKAQLTSRIALSQKIGPNLLADLLDQLSILRTEKDNQRFAVGDPKESDRGKLLRLLPDLEQIAVNPEEIEDLLARTSSYVASLAPQISTPRTSLQLAFEALGSTGEVVSIGDNDERALTSFMNLAVAQSAGNVRNGRNEYNTKSYCQLKKAIYTEKDPIQNLAHRLRLAALEGAYNFGGHSPPETCPKYTGSIDTGVTSAEGWSSWATALYNTFFGQ